MPTYRLNKLVRDKVPELMQAAGQSVTHHILAKPDRLPALQAKIHEEAAEVDLAAAHPAHELADLQTAFRQALAELGIAWAEFERLEQSRIQARGGFQTGEYVETVSVGADDPWNVYYAQDPARYPPADS